MAAPAALRNSTADLVRYAERDLTALWRGVETPQAARAALMDVLPALVTTYGSAASTLAAEWYDDQRDKKSVKGRFRAIPLDPSDRGAQALAGYATATAQNTDTLQTLVVGGIQRRIADHMRLTIGNSSIADPQAQGWVRVGEGACKSGWCDQFLDGEIHYVEGYDFPAHDHCTCYTSPAF